MLFGCLTTVFYRQGAMSYFQWRGFQWRGVPPGCSAGAGRSHGCSVLSGPESSERSSDPDRLPPETQQRTSRTQRVSRAVGPKQKTAGPEPHLSVLKDSVMFTCRLSGFRSVLCVSVGLYPPWRSSITGSSRSLNTSYVSSSPATQPTVMMNG